MKKGIQPKNKIWRVDHIECNLFILEQMMDKPKGIILTGIDFETELVQFIRRHYCFYIGTWEYKILFSDKNIYQLKFMNFDTGYAIRLIAHDITENITLKHNKPKDI